MLQIVSPLVVNVVSAIHTDIAALMRLPKSGRWYYRPKRAGGGKYQSSAPGEAPAIRTGDLLHSMRELEISPTQAQLSINASYARYLEDGTPAIARRPYVEPAVASARATFQGARSLL